MSSPTGNDDFMPDYDGFDESHLPQHTQFLDLTYGEGGERPEEEENDHYDDQEDEEEEGDEEDDGGGMLDSFMSGPSTHAAGHSSGDLRIPGKVVESGQEHTGRWTKEEHEAFMTALQTYGKEWKKVAAKVKTRTVVQTRTHAQKYFQKLQKATEPGGGGKGDAIDMGSLDAKKASTQKKKKPVARGFPSIASASKQNRRGSHATLSAAQVISGLSSSQPPSINAYVSTVSNASPQLAADLPPQQPRHGFSTSETSFVPAYPGTFSAVASSEGWMKHVGVKIVAPDPHAAMMRGEFPEPSPAATGKRKLAEIAAARMLAGVAGVTRIAEDRDGAPTPPPPPEHNNGSLNMQNAPPPPLLFGGGDLSGFSSARKGLSLQIVNPDSLGINYEEQRRRRGSGGDSPVTPWDGQLEALVSEKKKNEEFKFDNDEAGQSDNGYGGNVFLHPVCGLGTKIERTELHQAICDVDAVALKIHLGVLANLSDGVLQRQDEAGYCPLHTACAMSMARPENAAQVGEMVRMLLGAGADPKREDNQGNTALHWAARAGDRHVTELLLLKNCPQDGKNHRGDTALHSAMRAGERGMDVVSVLLENGARPGVLNAEFRRPIDVAGEGYLDEQGSLATLRAKEGKQQRTTVSRELKKALKDTATSRRDARANHLIRSAQSRTLVLHHPECLDHIPKSSSDWEAPDRITSIMRRVFPSSDPTGATETSGIFPHEVTVSKEFERAKLDLLSRVHSTEYLSFVNDLSKDLEKQHKDAGGSLEESEHGFASPPVVPFTPMVQRSMIKVAESSVKLGVNSDTAFSAGSLRAARRATGAVQHAVDCVLVGRNRNAFCVVRPPGHHAGSNGLLDGGESCGFCIFNNVAAGAMYAISDDRLLCDRCAIVDIDVHHGNGTEEIVKKCHDPSKLFFFSVHLYDNDRRKRRPNEFVYKFYPGTGAEDDLPLNIINVPITPLWREAGPTPASSRSHNTRGQKARSQDPQDDSNSSEIETPRETSKSDNGSETGSSSFPSSSAGGTSSGRLAYRQAIQNRLLPALRAFNPDLILISAGFDAARGDVGNARHERGGKERMGLDLEPEDYAWTTRKICEIADICCQGRVVTVLEGGYGRTPPTPPANPDEPQGLDRAIFAECAIRHLHALIDPYDTEQRFPSPQAGRSLLPALLQGDDIGAIPLSGVAGTVIGLAAGFGVYYANRTLENKLFLCIFTTLLIVFLSVGLFVGGCHEFEEVWGETKNVWRINGRFWDHHDLPMAILKPFGYSSSRSVLQITTFWLWLTLTGALHYYKFHQTGKINRQLALNGEKPDQDSDVEEGSPAISETEEASPAVTDAEAEEQSPEASAVAE